jgi:hypothetical protein
MNHFIDFIDAKKVEKTSIISHLKCSPEQGELMQGFCRL